MIYHVLLYTFLSTNGRYSTELLEKVKEMAEGIEVEDAPVFKTRDEIVKKQQVNLYTHSTSVHMLTYGKIKRELFMFSCLHHRDDDLLSPIISPTGLVRSRWRSQMIFATF